MTKISQEILDIAAEYYLNVIVSSLVSKLKRAPQEYRLRPDSGLHNFWEEICVQKQNEKWDGFNLVENYLESQISTIFNNQPEHIKLILSYSDDDSEMAFNETLVLEKILTELYVVAENYSNKSISAFLDGWH